MKPRNREVNIFNMSVLDLLTGALGAFCFLTLALFPYYFKAQHAAAAPANPDKDKQQQLAAEHKKLKAELANIKSGTGLAPFTLVSVFTSSGAGGSCAQIKVKKEQAPGAPTSIKVLPTSQVQHGYYSAAMLFMFEPGAYQLTFEVSGARAGCKLYISPMGKNASPQQSAALSSATQTLPWNYTVNPGQLVVGGPIAG
ncbi:MAG: hypothetical protein WAU33_14335 [Candidatus Binataceae bacterium]